MPPILFSLAIVSLAQGQFIPSSAIGVGAAPRFVAAADLNNDGRPDLVTANSQANSVTVLLNDGHGFFTEAAGSPFTVGLKPVCVAVGDFNGDGKPDIVTANSGDGTVTVLLGNSHGGFAPDPGSLFTVGPSPQFVTLADVNGDGRPDLIVTDARDNILQTILLGDGAGGFLASPGGPVRFGASLRSPGIADLDGDGIPDRVAVNPGDNTITIIPGNGGSSFTIPTGKGPVSVAVADFNGDGEPDLAVVNAGDNTVTVYLNSRTPMHPNPSAVTYAATNGAATAVNLSPPDFFGAAVAYNLSVAAPSGTLQPAPGSPFGAGASPQSAATADINGDGFPDLVTANYGDNTVSVLLGNGTGAFTAASGSPFAVGANPISIAIADFNGDGKPDLVTANAGGNNVSVLLGNGTGGFTAAAGSPFAVGVEPLAVAVGDFNADGNPDILAANNSDQTVTVLLGNGMGGFNQAPGSPVALGSAPQTIAVGDFNGDGKPDFVIAAYNNKVTILYGNGSGGFAGARPFPVGSFPQYVAAADLNGDGKLDIVTANSGNSSVTVLLANNSGGYTAATGSPLAVGMIPQSVALVDINGDGKPDIVAANAGDNTVSVLLGNGAGVFTTATGSPFNAGSTPFSIAAGDFNGDGRADLAITDVGGAAITVLLGAPAPTTSALTTAGASVVYGAAIPLTLKVASTGFGVPTGGAMFLDGSTALGAATQTSTPYLFNATGLDAGTHLLTGSYGGDAGSLASVSVAISLAVTPAPQTITFAGLANKVFGTASFPVSATASSALAVSFASNTPSVCTVSGANVTLVSVGLCTVEATQAGDPDHLAATPVDQKFMVTQAGQTITFAAPPNVVIGTAPFPLIATASSGLAVNFASTTATVCTVSAGTVTLLMAGSCAIQATQPGNIDYAAAPIVTQHFSVTPTTQTITFAPLSDEVFGSAVPPLSATASSGLAVSFASTTAPVCTVAGTTVTLVSVGTCTIQASQAGNSSYAAAPAVSQGFKVTQGSQSIAFSALANKVFGVAAFALSATATSGLAVGFTSTTLSVCTVSGANVTLVSAGSCTIQATQAGNNNYAAATPVTQSFSVTPASQTITFASLATKALGSGAFTVGATASSTLAVSFASLTLPVCTVSGAMVTLVSAGTCTLEATQAGNASYMAATPVDQNLTVTPATQTIAFGALSNQSLGTPPFLLTATASSGLPVAFASNTQAICTVSAGSVTLVSVGTCTVQATQAGNANHAAAAAVSQSFKVTLQSQSITFGPVPNQIVGTTPFALSATATSGLSVVFTSTTLPVCTVSGGNVTLVSIGTCTIQAAQPGNSDYAAATPVSQSFTVSPTGQTITFNAIMSLAFGSPPFAFTATASSGLPVSFTSTTVAVCTVSGGNVTLVSVGLCTIQATQPGNASYAAAPSVSQQFSVTAAVQTIAFGALANKVYGGASFAVSATASSGLAVSFASLTLPVCTVSASMVTLVGAGMCTVEASQAGNASYAAATPVDETFTIAPSAQTITFGPLPNKIFGASSIIVSATASSGVAVTFASTTLPVCTVAGTAVTLVSTGTCTIEASQPGNANYSAAAPVDQSFTIAAGSQTVTFAPIASQPFGPAPFPIAATASSGLPVTLASSTASVCTVSGSAATFVSVGVCTVQAMQPGNASYAAAASASQSFTVTQGTQTIAFAAIPNQPFSSAVVMLNATDSSGLVPTLTSASSTVCTVSGMALTLLSLGVCTVTATQAGNANYAAAMAVTQSFTVTQASQTITFGTIGGQPFGAAPVALSATASSGLAVVFASSSLAICSVSGTNATLVGAGVCVIQATQPGNATYAPATAVSQSFAVTPGMQTIAFGAPANQPLGKAPFLLSATASSGLAVVFSSTTMAVCTVSGATVTLVSAGTCTIQASQGGSTMYAAAIPVMQSFIVGAAAILNAVLNAASYSMSSLAPDGYTAIFGSNFSATSAQAIPSMLPATLAGAAVTITDSQGLTLPAPLYYVSATQINFVVPEGLAPGSATLTVTSFVGSKASLPVIIAPVAPALFTADASGKGVPAAIAFDYDGNGATQAPPVFACVGSPAVCAPDPISLGMASTNVYLALFGTGIRGRSGLAGVSVALGAVALQVSYAGAQSTYPGLDQINVLIDRSLAGAGLLTLQLTVDGAPANPVALYIQ